MIAAEEYRQALVLQLAGYALVNQLIPAQHLRQMPVAVLRGVPGGPPAIEVAQGCGLELAGPPGAHKTRDAQRLRTHRSAAVRSADIRRGTDQARAYHGQAASSSVATGRAGNADRHPNRSFGSAGSGSRSMRAWAPRSSWWMRRR